MSFEGLNIFNSRWYYFEDFIIIFNLMYLQPKNDSEPLLDTLNEYKGILGQFPEVLKLNEVRNFIDCVSLS